MVTLVTKSGEQQIAAPNLMNLLINPADFLDVIEIRFETYTFLPQQVYDLLYLEGPAR